MNTCTLKQVIDGFGAADTWAGAMSVAQNTLFWDPTNGIGLSLLRIGIEGNGSPLGSGAYSDAKAAHAFGVNVWAAPWSPPAADKSNSSADNGGNLNTASYMSWASVLSGFPATFKKNTGFDLYGISVQNEPDFTASYESCIYSASQMVAFAKVLGPLLHALSPPVKLLAAEPDVWDHMWTSGDKYGTAILADAEASAAVDIFAMHDYGHKTDSSTTRPAPPAGTTQHIWETEVSWESPEDLTITQGLMTATWIYAALNSGNANAWHYWWLINGGGANGDGEGLLAVGGSTTNTPKRLWTTGNYSKFVRPGYNRVDVSGTLPANVLITPFKGPSDGTVVIVAINSGGADVTVPIYLSGSSAASVTPYTTSASQNLAAGTAMPVSASSFSAALPAKSVTTFVAK